MTKRTCGPMYLEAITKYGTTPEAYRAFAAGFITGQAEKIRLGACRAAMFRPSAEYFPMVCEIVEDTAERYGLLWCALNTTAGTEVWLARDSRTRTAIYLLPSMSENSPAWHLERGRLCGVPDSENDPRFHERAGYGERCD